MALGLVNLSPALSARLRGHKQIPVFLRHVTLCHRVSAEAFLLRAGLFALFVQPGASALFHTFHKPARTGANGSQS